MAPDPTEADRPRLESVGEEPAALARVRVPWAANRPDALGVTRADA